jgi:hypothetical protein
MYIYYVLRGTQREQPIEQEGDIDEEHFPDIDLDNGPQIINYLVQQLRAQGITGEWSECDLTDGAFESEDSYIYFNGRWMRRADAPWRKDRSN